MYSFNSRESREGFEQISKKLLDGVVIKTDWFRGDEGDDFLQPEYYGNLICKLPEFHVNTNQKLIIYATPLCKTKNGSYIEDTECAYDGNKEYYKNLEISYIEMNQFQYNCGLMIVWNLRTIIYKQGLGKITLALAEALIEACGYSSVQATVNRGSSNQTFKKMALNKGWKVIDEFRNDRSGSDIEVLSKHF